MHTIASKMASRKKRDAGKMAPIHTHTHTQDLP